MHAGPLTGGSKVLVAGEITTTMCLTLGYCCFAIALTILLAVLPSQCWSIGFALMSIAHQYSAPPFKLNHRGFGEVMASVAGNVLLPAFGAMVQPSCYLSSSFDEVAGIAASPVFHRSLAVLVVPAFLLKVGLFVALNMADRRADWLGGKYTLPVLLGEEMSARYLQYEEC